MCGIFAYLNYETPKKRKEIVDFLINGLSRLEYRGYDSAGFGIDNYDPQSPQKLLVVRKQGDIKTLRKFTETYNEQVESAKDGEKPVGAGFPASSMDDVLFTHVGIAHTRWATHGPPSDVNSHPHRSGDENEFLVVHNGIITNYAELKAKLIAKMPQKNGQKLFESDTDTEVIAKLCKYYFDKAENAKEAKQYFKDKLAGKEMNLDEEEIQRLQFQSFVKLMTRVSTLLEGAYALIVKSYWYPNQLVAIKKGSPMILGIKLPDLKLSPSTPTKDTANKDHSGDDDSEKRSVKVNSTANESLLSVPFSERGEIQKAEYFISSDSTAIADHTKLVIMLQDNDLLHFQDGKYSYFNTADDTFKERMLETLDIEMGQIDMGGFDHFMLKEIFDQPNTVASTMRGRINFQNKTVKLGGIENYIADIRNSRRIIFIACGTSYHSAVATRPIMEELTGIPVTLELASDFLDRNPRILRNDTCIFISQSGETADSLKALEFCKASNALCVGVVNTVGSAIARATHCGIYLMCGPEIGVASTKAYTSQIIAITMMALKLGEDKVSTLKRRHAIIDGLARLADDVNTVLNPKDKEGNFVKRTPYVLESPVVKSCIAISKEINETQYKSLLVMGRGYHFGTALEGALKIKEISYIHCEGVMTGEIKHGTIALIGKEHGNAFAGKETKTMPIVYLMTLSNKKDADRENSFHLVTSRGGSPIVIYSKEPNIGDEKTQMELVIDQLNPLQNIQVPNTVDCLQCILNIIPLQLLSYYIAKFKGINVDRPRNLAKSVTTL